MFVGVHVHVCTHSGWKHAGNLGQYTNPHMSAKCRQILTNLSAYVKIGLLSWLLMFVRVHMHTCTPNIRIIMHATWGSIQTLISQPNYIRSSLNFQHMSRLVSWVDFECSWVCTCVSCCLLSWLLMFVRVHMHTCTPNIRIIMHATWGSIQTLISQPNYIRSSLNFQHMSRLVSWVDF